MFYYKIDFKEVCKDKLWLSYSNWDSPEKELYFCNSWEYVSIHFLKKMDVLTA